MIGSTPWTTTSRVARRSGSVESLLDRELVEESIDISSVAGVLDEIFDPATGDRWMPLFAGSTAPYGEASHLLTTEQGLMVVRMMCRYLAAENEYAINILENRISYIVGDGMKLTFQPRDKMKDDPEEESVRSALEELQLVLDDELDRIDFDGIQEETVRRADRDGEAIIRVFHTFGGIELRFVEPRDVTSAGTTYENAPFGIETNPEDVTDVRAYWIAGERVPAEQIYHYKANVDSNVRRGISSLWPIRKNLHRAGKLLKGISSQAQFQASISAIRSHEVGDAQTLRRFADDRSNYAVTDPATGVSQRVQKINAGRVIDTSSRVKWEFPSVGVGIDKLRSALQADLLAAASRMVMPEYMVTSDASNGNYASLLAADAPAHKMFKRAQRRFSRFFADVADDVIEAKMKIGELPADSLIRFRVVAVPPEIATRNPKEDAETKEIQYRNGVVSRRTWQIQSGLDPDQEDRYTRDEKSAAADDLPPIDPTDPPAPPKGRGSRKRLGSSQSDPEGLGAPGGSGSSGNE